MRRLSGPFAIKMCFFAYFRIDSDGLLPGLQCKPLRGLNFKIAAIPTRIATLGEMAFLNLLKRKLEPCKGI